MHVTDQQLEMCLLKVATNLTQDQIKEVTGVKSQTTVHRGLIAAMKAGLYEEESRFTVAADREALRQIYHRALNHLAAKGPPYGEARAAVQKWFVDTFEQERKLETKFQQLKHISVLNSGGTGTDPNNYHSRLATFARAAAVYVDHLLNRTERVGVTWGRTLFEVKEGLLQFYGADNSKPKCQFVPLAGDSLTNSYSKLSASSIAADLNENLNASLPDESPGLGPVPARVPRLTKAEARGIRKVIELSKGYATIFGDNGQITQLNCILTSVGTASSVKDDPWLNDLMRCEGMTVDQIDEMFVGDIGGVLLPRNNKKEKAAGEINSRWTGVSLEHLAACASQEPGVVVLAIGAAKRDIVVAAIDRSLVTELVVDQDLATALSD